MQDCSSGWRQNSQVMNWVFILIILVLGLGMGGWASIKTMDEKVKEFELFDRCNGC